MTVLYTKRHRPGEGPARAGDQAPPTSFEPLGDRHDRGHRPHPRGLTLSSFVRFFVGARWWPEPRPTGPASCAVHRRTPEAGPRCHLRPWPPSSGTSHRERRRTPSARSPPRHPHDQDLGRPSSARPGGSEAPSSSPRLRRRADACRGLRELPGALSTTPKVCPPQGLCPDPHDPACIPVPRGCGRPTRTLVPPRMSEGSPSGYSGRTPEASPISSTARSTPSLRQVPMAPTCSFCRSRRFGPHRSDRTSVAVGSRRPRALQVPNVGVRLVPTRPVPDQNRILADHERRL